MNQQEIDRLFDKYSTHYGIDSYLLPKDAFAQAAAEIRRQALEEAAQHFDARAESHKKGARCWRSLGVKYPEGAEAILAQHCEAAAAELRALAQPNGAEGDR